MQTWSSIANADSSSVLLRHGRLLSEYIPASKHRPAHVPAHPVGHSGADQQPAKHGAGPSTASAEGHVDSDGKHLASWQSMLQTTKQSDDISSRDVKIQTENGSNGNKARSKVAAEAFGVAQRLSKILATSSDAQLLRQLLPDADPVQFKMPSNDAYRSKTLQQVSNFLISRILMAARIPCFPVHAVYEATRQAADRQVTWLDGRHCQDSRVLSVCLMH